LKDLNDQDLSTYHQIHSDLAQALVEVDSGKDGSKLRANQLLTKMKDKLSTLESNISHEASLAKSLKDVNKNSPEV